MPESTAAEACCGDRPGAASSPAPSQPVPLRRRWRAAGHCLRRLDGAWLAIGLIPALLALFDPGQVLPALEYLPAEMIASVLGGGGLWPIVLGALVGAPAYLNGYATVPLVEALLAQGMSNGAAMSFVIAGGASCIPAAIAVWALVKPRVFGAYLGIAFAGSVAAGIVWNAVA